jgi:hypothetical protein
MNRTMTSYLVCTIVLLLGLFAGSLRVHRSGGVPLGTPAHHATDDAGELAAWLIKWPTAGGKTNMDPPAPIAGGKTNMDPPAV